MRTALRKLLGQPPRKSKLAGSSNNKPAMPETGRVIAKQYTHEPLDHSRQIQLASISPAIDSDATLQIVLHTFTWERLPTFAYVANSLAFSYLAISDIGLCGEMYVVTRSLDVYLRHLRQENEMQLLFIPALCMRPEYIGLNSTIVQRMQCLASRHLDAATMLNRMDESVLLQLNARPLRFRPGEGCAIHLNLLHTRLAERATPTCDAGRRIPYMPLDRLVGEIRLLRVTRTDSASLPNYELINVALKDNMDFIAFSYTWGGEADQQEINIGGVPVKVRRNLYDILIQVAATMSETDATKVGYYWFDALCIDQDDLAEKSLEIRRMSDIYAASRYVFAWLGPGTVESANVLIQITLGQPKAGYRDDTGSIILNRNRLEEAPELYANIARLLMRPFFTRAWCTQELAVARKLFVVAGRRMADWSSLASLSPAHTDWQAYRPLIAGITAQPQEKLAFFLGRGFARLQLVERLQRRRKSGRPTTLLSLLLATLHLDSAIAKDKIYSLWSMASDADELLPEPNYDQTDEQVFFDFTKAWIMKYDRLDIISVRAMQRDRWCEGIVPSWVTDWSSSRLSRPLLSSYPSALRDEELDEVEETKLYSAAGNIGVSYGIVNEDSSSSALLASGLSCDVLKFVGEANSGQDRPFGSWFEALEAECSRSEEAVELRRDFLKAMCADRDPTGVRMSKSSEYQNYHLDVIEIFRDDVHGDQETGSLIWRNHIHQTIAGGRLAITHQGHLGLVPSEAEVGDEVAVVFGCSVPLIFRNDATGTRFIVGDCYFRRMMDGQMVEAAGGEEYCMRNALPGLGSTTVATGSFEAADSAATVEGTGVKRRVSNERGIPFRELGTAETIVRLPSGKALDPRPGGMRAEVPGHMAASTSEGLFAASYLRPTPGGPVRIQPFIIA